MTPALKIGMWPWGAAPRVVPSKFSVLPLFEHEFSNRPAMPRPAAPAATSRNPNMRLVSRKLRSAALAGWSCSSSPCYRVVTPLKPCMWPWGAAPRVVPSKFSVVPLFGDEFSNPPVTPGLAATTRNPNKRIVFRKLSARDGHVQVHHVIEW